jgi:hypothetical protein
MDYIIITLKILGVGMVIKYLVKIYPYLGITRLTKPFLNNKIKHDLTIEEAKIKKEQQIKKLRESFPKLEKNLDDDNNENSLIRKSILIKLNNPYSNVTDDMNNLHAWIISVTKNKNYQQIKECIDFDEIAFFDDIFLYFSEVFVPCIQYNYKHGEISNTKDNYKYPKEIAEIITILKNNLSIFKFKRNEKEVFNNFLDHTICTFKNVNAYTYTFETNS